MKKTKSKVMKKKLTKKLKKVTNSSLKKVNVDEKMYTTATINRKKGKMLAIASSDVEDRDGEILSVDGWDLKAFKTNPVLLWMHNRNMAHNGLPIGKVKKIGFKKINGKKKLVFEPEFNTSTEFNRTVEKFFQDGILNTFSVGFLPTKREESRFINQELLEISAVPVPSLAEAQVIERAKELGIKKSKALEIIENKSVVPFKAYVKADVDKAWEGNKAVNRLRKWAGGPEKEDLDFIKYKEGFAWFDHDDPENFSAYKLSHHDIVNGGIKTIWKGVVSAMAVLLGAKGGVDLPESDKKRVYNHLVKHYEQFNKEPPEYKHVLCGTYKEYFKVAEKQIQKEYEQETKKHIQLIVSEIRGYKKQIKKPNISNPDVSLTKDEILVAALKHANNVLSQTLEEVNKKSNSK